MSKINTKVSMDVIDMKILSELDRNSRIPYTILGKRVRLSKQAVKVRVDKLLSSGVITSFKAFINMRRLGFTPNKIFISFQNISESKRQEIINYLVERETIGAVTLFDSSYDLYFGVITRTPGDLDAELSAFYNKFADNIRERKIIALIDAMILPRDYLLNTPRELQPRQKTFHTQTKPLEELKETDQQILEVLNCYPTLPFTDIAKKIGHSVQTVLNRVKYLEKMGVINGFGMLLNETIFIQYMLLLELNSPSKEVIDKLMAFFSTNPQVAVVIKTMGDWDYEVCIEGRDLAHCQEVIDQFRIKFSPYLRSFFPLLVKKMAKMSYMPMKKE